MTVTTIRDGGSKNDDNDIISEKTSRNNSTSSNVLYLDPHVEDFIIRLPKVELHVHLDGSFDPSVIFSYMKRTPKNHERDAIQNCRTQNEFIQLCTCRGKKSFEAMITCFEIFVPLVQGNIELIEQLSYNFVKRQAEQNIIYTEVRYSPHLLANGGSFNDNDGNDKSVLVNADPIIDAVTRGLRLGEEEYGVKVNQILCCLSFRPDWSDDVVRIAHERRDDTPCAVVGIDIAAGEDHFDKNAFPDNHNSHYQAFQKAKKLNLNVTMHAGEVGSISNILHAVEHYNASRIGHGYRVIEDKAIMDRMKELNIHFEVCPTSSVETGAWMYKQCKAGKTVWTDHPTIHMLDHGMNVGLNSDDPAVFDTSLTWQFRIAVLKMGLKNEQLIHMTKNCLEAAFLCNEEKIVHRKAIEKFEISV